MIGRRPVPILPRSGLEPDPCTKVLAEGLTVARTEERDADGDGARDTVVIFGPGGGSVVLLDMGGVADTAALFA